MENRYATGKKAVNDSFTLTDRLVCKYMSGYMLESYIKLSSLNNTAFCRVKIWYPTAMRHLD